MGNIPTSTAPTQILPAESYIYDVGEIRFVQSLGSTRFMKVARVEHVEGPMVAKVFIPFDQSFSEEPYKEQIIKIRENLRDQPNCLAFSRVYKTARCSILTRPYHKDTLYDRLSTRPFLVDIEKRWIAFQLLKALGQCRIARVCHGDIKSQNILVSSSNWVRITDFASYKPAFLPYDNPSNFTYFFDTSRRRCCNLAPERFKKSEDLNYSPRLPNDTTSLSAELTESMDIFAMGCVLVELFTDGRRVPFTLGQLIDYKKMDDYQAKLYLERILAEIPFDMGELITIMLQRDPKLRRERYEEFSPCTSNLFPSIFELFLYRFFKEFLITAPILQSGYPKVKVQTQILPMEPDSVITKLYCERDNFLSQLSRDNSDSVLLIICLITSNIRACKTDSIILLQKLSKITKSSIVVDRILPYLIYMLTDYFAQVRAEAIYVITEILSSLDSIPPDEYGIFIDYVFPRMKAITCDLSNLVRMALAVNLGPLATTSLRFLNESFKHIHDESGLLCDVQNEGEESKASEQELQRFERQALQEAVSEIFVNLCGSENEVRECLFSANSLIQLCEFFGSTRKSDVLMHMITLLNDKLDWRLRACFFENCSLVASPTSPVRNSKLKPFLLQGLQDTEEFVVLKTLVCIHTLSNINCLEKSTIFDLYQYFVPFLIHPNKWLRVAVVNILSVLDSIYSVADVYCRLMPLVNPFLKESLINFNDKLVLYQCLTDPIPRKIWKIVTEQPNINQLLSEMENRRTIDKLGGGRNSLFSATATSIGSISSRLGGDRFGHSRKSSEIETALKKLTNSGLTEQLEDKVISFKNILSKMDTIKKSQNSDKNQNDRIYLEDYPKVHRKIFDLDKGVHRGAISKSNLNMMEESVEYREIYDIDFKDLSGRSINETPSLGFEPPIGLPTSSRILVEPSSLQISSSRFILDEVLSHKRKKFIEQQKISQGDHRGATVIHGAMPHASNSSKPEVRVGLIAHLHEHSDAIKRLAVHPNHSHFASCSADRTVKIWSAQVDGPTVIQSKQTLGSNQRPNSIQFMGNNGNLIAIASSNGELKVHDLKNQRYLKTFTVDKEVDGPITEIYSTEHLIFALTHHSSVYCYDTRAPSRNRNFAELAIVFKRKARNSYGLMTSFTLDQVNRHWMVLTGSCAGRKNIHLWDIRFAGLEVKSWEHPSTNSILTRSWSLVGANGSNQVFTSSSREAEISLWDLTSQDRTHILWPSEQDPLTYKMEMVTTALVSWPHLNSTSIFTGDSKGSLRYWNLEHPERSSYLSGPYRKYLLPASIKSPATFALTGEPTNSKITYRSMTAHDRILKIIKEDREKGHNNPIEKDAHRFLQVGEYHRSSITDLCMVSNDILVSSGSDGVLKLWKAYKH